MTNGIAATLSANSCVTPTRNGPSVIERQLDDVGIINTIGGNAENYHAGGPLPTLANGTVPGYHNAVAVPYTLKIRSGCAVDANGKPAGKGALVQVNKAATLATTNDQYLFQPVGVDIYNGLETGDKAATLTTQGGGTASGPSVVVPIHDQATRFTGKRGEKSDGKGNGLGIGNPGDPMNTLTGGDRHAVVYAVDQGGGKSGANVTEDKAPTLCTTHGGEPAVAYGLDRASFNQGAMPVSYAMQGFGDYKESNQASACKARDYKDATDLVTQPNYIVRRLTPTECARLQGFADKHGHIEKKKNLSDEEYAFWCEVFLTKALIDGTVLYNADGDLVFKNRRTPYKHKTKAQMLTWFNKLWTDSAEYKMWGNGIALPPALYCMQGIIEALNTEEEDAWML